jgi:hypothetical protein
VYHLTGIVCENGGLEHRAAAAFRPNCRARLVIKDSPIPHNPWRGVRYRGDFAQMHVNLSVGFSNRSLFARALGTNDLGHFG